MSTEKKIEPVGRPLADAGRIDSVNLGSIDKISPGQGRCYLVKGDEIAVFRQRDGRLFAVQNRCPHRQGPLSEGIMGNGKVICPLHSHKFDLATGAGSEHGECVKTWPVREVNREVVIGPAAC